MLYTPQQPEKQFLEKGSEKIIQKNNQHHR